MVTDCDFGDGDVEAALLGSDIRLTFLGTRDRDTIVREARGYAGLFVQWAQIDREMMVQLPDLRAIVRYGIGLDNIDVAAAAELGIAVSNVDDYCLDEVADHAAAAIYAANRRQPQASAGTHGGAWTLPIAQTPRPPHSDPVGIVGMGRIGRGVAARLHALGFPIHYFDPQVDEGSLGELVGIRHDTVNDLARAVNHLTLHVPLIPATDKLIDAGVIESLGADGHLVNTSRGGLVDEQSLLSALDGGSLAWASLDVLVQEPPTGESSSAKLSRHPRTTVTPHIAYLSTDSVPRLRNNAALRMRALL
jgi:D-3-phosphoglycerate dehydrogenase